MRKNKNAKLAFPKRVFRKIGVIFHQIFPPSFDSITKALSTVADSSISPTARLWGRHRINNVFIEEYSYLAENSCVSFTSIGKFCSIGPNFLCGYGIHPLNGVSTSPMFYSTFKQNGITLASTDKIEERRQVRIGNDVFIGANVTILDGVVIGDGAVIGAGAVVNRDIPPYAVAAGVPARIIRYRFSDEQIKALLNIHWWDFPESKLKLVERYFFDVDKFIEICRREKE